MRLAIVHDWLTGMRGGERCLEVLCAMYPGADIYTMISSTENLSPLINDCKITESFAQRLPGVKKYYRYLLPVYPQIARNVERKIHAAHQRDPYDLVVSVSHCFAKNVKAPAGVKHLSYCLTPMRYIWDQYDAYFAEHRFEPLISKVAAALRPWDVKNSDNVDSFIGISDFVAKRIGRVYQRDAGVIFPPVTTDWISPRAEHDVGEGFLCVNALVPYKNVHLVVEAFNANGLPLTVIGSGPEAPRLRQMARPNIRFLENIDDEQLASFYQSSKAMVFAAEEDFGMTPVEMQAAGRPVIAYGRGGALETVSTASGVETGVFFGELTAEAINEAVDSFLDQQHEFTVNNCCRQARKFSLETFVRSFTEAVSELGVDSPSIDIEALTAESGVRLSPGQ